ncbi:MAG TPA: serpin family protein, partial [Ilumatobacteraceae bacterium]
MQRRTFLTALLATPAALALLEACGSSSTSAPTSTTQSTSFTQPGSSIVPISSQPTSPAKDGVARSAEARIAASDFSAASVAINGFGVDLYNRLTTSADTTTPTNLVFSPASIAVALAMTLAGAKGTTATEMDHVLHVADEAGLAMSMNALTSALDGDTKSSVGADGAPVDVTLAIANSLWAQDDLAFETAFLDLLASQYGAGLQLVDYKSDPEAARQLINAWVDDKTAHRIPQLLGAGVLTPDTRLTLVNAIYMKAPWANPFAKASTAPSSFTTGSGTTVQAPTMNIDSHFDYTKGAGWQGVVLPYVNGDLSMLIVLPDATGGASLNDAAGELAGMAAGSTSTRVQLALPTFDIETMATLTDVLAAMGMPTAISKDADFSGMTTTEKLHIGAVVHQANITVDEDGTEAAAATAVVMATSAAIA